MKNPVILVVDDQENIRQLLAVSLELRGYKVITARDGVDALRCLASHHVDLMLTDWEMPEMGGAELTRHVSSAYTGLPVMVLSCHDAPLKKDMQANLGIRSWFRKPFRVREIQHAVYETLGVHC